MILIAPVLVDSSLESYKIVEIDRISNFAGKMGKEVRETWRVTNGRQEFTVIVMPYHTNVANTMQYSTGDTVNIKSRARGQVVRVTLREISK